MAIYCWYKWFNALWWFNGYSLLTLLDVIYNCLLVTLVTLIYYTLIWQWYVVVDSKPITLDTGRKLNVHMTFRIRPGVLWTFYVGSVYVLYPHSCYSKLKYSIKENSINVLAKKTRYKAFLNSPWNLICQSNIIFWLLIKGSSTKCLSNIKRI